MSEGLQKGDWQGDWQISLGFLVAVGVMSVTLWLKSIVDRDVMPYAKKKSLNLF